MPTAVAIQWVEVTTPNVPSISGRVVNGLGLTLSAMDGLFCRIGEDRTRSQWFHYNRAGHGAERRQCLVIGGHVSGGDCCYAAYPRAATT